MKTLSIKTNAGDYSATGITKEEFFELLKKTNENGFASIPLGKGTSYMGWNEYEDDAVANINTNHVHILIVEEHDLEEKQAVNLKTK